MNKEHLLPIEKSRLGVIGGSGFYSMDQIKVFKRTRNQYSLW
jgi:5'-methylthioadenosine phosphorylase